MILLLACYFARHRAQAHTMPPPHPKIKTGVGHGLARLETPQTNGLILAFQQPDEWREILKA
jgi:hypothetical protein